eukprot:GHVS01053105.1.p1 GENE.GHVS01053105.1~~GHVS01053105.1.p1  ORF type:complete len:551 (+),score=167.21 GHVS01053105.1:181-1833(+)
MMENSSSVPIGLAASSPLAATNLSTVDEPSAAAGGASPDHNSTNSHAASSGAAAATAVEDMNMVASSVPLEEQQMMAAQQASPPAEFMVSNTSGLIPSCAPAPLVEVKLFVGRLPRTHTEEMIRPLFAQYGSVVEVVVIRDKQTQQHKGSAFVRMASICQADLAIRSLNNIKVVDASMGPLTVKYAIGELENLGLPATAIDPTIDQAKLFVGSLPKTVTESQVRDLFGRFGTIDEVFIMKDNSGMPKGCAFVKFAYKEQAMFAMNQLNGKMTVQGASRPVEVRFAAPRRPPGEKDAMVGGGVVGMAGGPMGGYAAAGQMMGFGGRVGMGGGGGGTNSTPRQVGGWKEYFSNDGRPYFHNEITNMTQWERPVEFEDTMMMVGGGAFGGLGGGGGGGQEPTGPAGSNIFIFHIPNEWTQQDLIHNFGSFGTVISGRIAQDRQTGRNRGFAFVSYDNPDAASNAVSNMNGFMACGKRLKVTIKKGEEGSAMGVKDGGMLAAAGQVAQNFAGGGGGWQQHAQQPPTQPAAVGGGAPGGFGGGGFGGGPHRFTPY